MSGNTAYDLDFYEWTQEQARVLREAGSARLNVPVDWENVAEEIESMGRSDLTALRSHIARIIEHLLKLEYSPARDPRSDWQVSAANHRLEAIGILEMSPSLRGKVELHFDRCWRDGRRLAALGLKKDGVAETSLPADCPYAMPQIMDDDWFPTNRHGLE